MSTKCNNRIEGARKQCHQIKVRFGTKGPRKMKSHFELDDEDAGVDKREIDPKRRKKKYTTLGLSYLPNSYVCVCALHFYGLTYCVFVSPS